VDEHFKVPPGVKFVCEMLAGVTHSTPEEKADEEEEEEGAETEEAQEAGVDSFGNAPHEQHQHQTLLQLFGDLMRHDDATLLRLRRRYMSASDEQEHRAQLLREIVALSFPDAPHMSAAEAAAGGDTIILQKLIRMNSTVETYSWASPFLRNMTNVMQSGPAPFLWCHTFNMPMTCRIVEGHLLGNPALPFLEVRCLLQSRSGRGDHENHHQHSILTSAGATSNIEFVAAIDSGMLQSKFGGAGRHSSRGFVEIAHLLRTVADDQGDNPVSCSSYLSVLSSPTHIKTGYIKHAQSNSRHSPIGKGTGGWGDSSLTRELAPKAWGFVPVSTLLPATSLNDAFNPNGSLNDALLASVVRSGLVFLGTIYIYIYI
jgi:hypothetical protein